MRSPAEPPAFEGVLNVELNFGLDFVAEQLEAVTGGQINVGARVVKDWLGVVEGEDGTLECAAGFERTREKADSSLAFPTHGPTHIEVLQPTRGEIIVGDGNWIKPYCGVIIPYWDKESEFTTRELARQIRELRDNFSYDPIFYVSIGSDIGEGKKVDDIDSLNKIELKSKKIILIENILNEIEVMDKEYNSNLELERLKKMEFDEWFNFINENGR